MLVAFRLASLVGCLVAYRLVAGWQLFVCCFLVLLLLLFMLRDWCGFCGYCVARCLRSGGLLYGF